MRNLQMSYDAVEEGEDPDDALMMECDDVVLVGIPGRKERNTVAYITSPVSVYFFFIHVHTVAVFRGGEVVGKYLTHAVEIDFAGVLVDEILSQVLWRFWVRWPVNITAKIC